MINISDTTLNKIIEELRSGKRVEDILIEYKEIETEVKELIPLLISISEIPTVGAPIPNKRRDYLQELQPRSFLNNFYALFRATALPIGVMAGLLMFVATGFAANKSQPGQHLFTVKKSFERTSLIFTPEDEKGLARLAITEKRLAEAEQVLANPNSNPKSTTAALEELVSQTNETISDVQKVASSKQLGASEVSLLNSLAEITKKQEVLVNSIKPLTDSEAQSNAEVVKETKIASESIRELIATATEQTLANIPVDENKVIITGGTITSLDKTKIVVEKTTFTIDLKNLTILKDNKDFDYSKLTAKSKITISGTKSKTNILADKIIIVTLFDQGAVKGETTTKNEPSTTPLPTPKSDAPLPPNNTVNGGFIPEQP